MSTGETILFANRPGFYMSFFVKCFCFCCTTFGANFMEMICVCAGLWECEFFWEHRKWLNCSDFNNHRGQFSECLCLLSRLLRSIHGAHTSRDNARRRLASQMWLQWNWFILVSLIAGCCCGAQQRSVCHTVYTLGTQIRTVITG